MNSIHPFISVLLLICAILLSSTLLGITGAVSAYGSLSRLEACPAVAAAPFELQPGASRVRLTPDGAILVPPK